MFSIRKVALVVALTLVAVSAIAQHCPIGQQWTCTTVGQVTNCSCRY